MTTRIVTFDGYAIGSDVYDGANFTAIAQTHGLFGGEFTGLSQEVQEDADGRFLDDGSTVMSGPDLLPDHWVQRYSFLVDIQAGEPAIIRVVAPVTQPDGVWDEADATNDDQYVTAELRRVGGAAQLTVFLRDPVLEISDGVPWNNDIVASVLTGVDASAARGLFTVEISPRRVCLWWDPGRTTFRRTTPGLVAPVPCLDGQVWGWCTRNVFVRSIEIQTDPPPPDASLYRITATVADVDAMVEEIGGEEPTTVWDTSRPALVEYAMPAHITGYRAVGRISIAPGQDSSEPWVWDSHFDRVDEARTLILVPHSQTHAATMTTRARVVSGLQSPHLEFTRGTGEGTGPDGGIGSGRTHLFHSGELCLDLPVALEGSTISVEYQSIASVSGGDDAYDQYSTEQMRTWALNLLMRPTHSRRTERVGSIAGDARQVWFTPPLEHVAPVQIIALPESTVLGPNRTEVRLAIREV